MKLSQNEIIKKLMDEVSTEKRVFNRTKLLDDLKSFWYWDDYSKEYKDQYGSKIKLNGNIKTYTLLTLGKEIPLYSLEAAKMINMIMLNDYIERKFDEIELKKPVTKSWQQNLEVKK